MKLLLASDLHVDVWPSMGDPLLREWEKAEVDAIVIAGDIGEYRSWVVQDFIKKLCKHHTVIMVHGNHSYWGSSPEKVDEIVSNLQKEIGENFVHLKHGDAFWFKKQLFMGDTLWYPRPTDLALTKEFPDYNRIKHFVPWVYDEHQKTVEFLEKTVTPETIVITHHVPTEQAITEEYQGDPWNHCFVYDMGKLIETRQPKLWLFGHTHFPWDMTFGKTRLYCNPRGYPNEKSNSKEFFKKCIVEI